MDKNIIKIKNLSKKFKSQILFSHINLELERGLSHFIIGKSGSGKSTFAEILLNLDFPDQGEIFIDGKNIKDKDYIQAKNIFMIFQDPVDSLNLRLKVIDYFNLILDNLKVPKSKRLDEIKKFLDYIEFQEDFLNKKTKILSGGQKQRLAIARCIFQRPKIIVFDESFANLDDETAYSLMDKITELKDKFDLTYIFISHDTKFIEKYAQSIFEFENKTIIKKL